ncbi:hypothetical protein VTO42DRAFT_3939 [Malbranchea cinnamomea]
MELNQMNPELFTLKQLISQMNAIFDDPNHRIRAAVELCQIHQSNRPYCEFITDFEDKLLVTNGFTWDDVLKKEYLTKALDHDLHLAIVTLSSGLTYTQYRDVSAAVTIAKYDSNTMDWEPTSSNARVKWVSEAKKEKCRKERLCICCDVSGNFIRECSYHPAANPAFPSRTAGVTPPVIVLPVLDDAESSTEQEQGKE